MVLGFFGIGGLWWYCWSGGFLCSVLCCGFYLDLFFGGFCCR